MQLVQLKETEDHYIFKNKVHYDGLMPTLI